MNKKIVALAVAAAFAIPAAASAQTTLFGQFKYEVGALESGERTVGINEDGDVVFGIGDTDRNAVHSSLGTRIGIRGAEDLGGGLQGIYRFQSGFGNVNSPLNNATFNLGEENWVGLQGGFGRLLLGRSDTAFKQGHTAFRVFTDSLADLNNRPASLGRAEGVHYVTPSFGGLTVAATVEPNGSEFDAYWSLGAIYRQGPLFVSAAVESAADTGVYTDGRVFLPEVDADGETVGAVDTGLFTGAGKTIIEDNTNWQVGATYTWNDVTFGALYQDIDDVAKWVTVPVTYRMGNVGLRAAVQYRDRDYADSMTNVAVGASYHFSGRTEAFVNVWNDDELDLIGTPAGGDADTHVGLGLRHSF